MGGSLALPLALFVGCSQGTGNASTGDAGGDVTTDAADGGGDAPTGSDAPSGDDAPSASDAPSGEDAPSDAATGNDAGDSGGENDASGAGDADAGCTAGETVCGTACVDEQTDAVNCGACGHSCGGGACSAGACQPWAIAIGRNAPLDMAIDANNIYWTENLTGGVYQVAKSGGTVVTIKAADGVSGSAWAVTTEGQSGTSTAPRAAAQAPTASPKSSLVASTTSTPRTSARATSGSSPRART